MIELTNTKRRQEELTPPVILEELLKEQLTEFPKSKRPEEANRSKEKDFCRYNSHGKYSQASCHMCEEVEGIPTTKNKHEAPQGSQVPQPNQKILHQNRWAMKINHQPIRNNKSQSGLSETCIPNAERIKEQQKKHENKLCTRSGTKGRSSQEGKEMKQEDGKLWGDYPSDAYHEESCHMYVEIEEILEKWTSSEAPQATSEIPQSFAVTFTNSDHNRPISVSGYLCDVKISSMLVDRGLVVNILPLHILMLLNISTGDLQTTRIMVQGFKPRRTAGTGQSIPLLGDRGTGDNLMVPRDRLQSHTSLHQQINKEDK
ncbi:hypothetical protein LIER_35693 [Lithospermum erythrorhizon]|uniref:Uncharacterized protein n=1 Tax=Lithospermum erythrorhizon TaxID=34254 RepID=A0AAV3NVA1_LITER